MAVECHGFEKGESCLVKDVCVTKYVWQKINESINQTVDSIKLDTLVEESKKKCCCKNKMEAQKYEQNNIS